MYRHGFAICARMSKFWLHNESIYKMTKYYDQEMEEWKTGSFQFLVEILKKIQISSKEKLNLSTKKNALNLLTDPQNGLTQQEIKEEIQSLLAAVSDF